jgi:hypothetical protein
LADFAEGDPSASRADRFAAPDGRTLMGCPASFFIILGLLPLALPMSPILIPAMPPVTAELLLLLLLLSPATTSFADVVFLRGPATLFPMPAA